MAGSLPYPASDSHNITGAFFALDMAGSGKQDVGIMNEDKKIPEQRRSRRWEEGLVKQALDRGGSHAVAQRAVALVREMNIAPWVALAVAERIISLQDARLLDAAARCKDLQSAVLDARVPVPKLRATLPYAPHMLAVEVLPLLPPGQWTQRELVKVLQVLMQAEQRRDEDGRILPLGTRSAQEYAQTVGRMGRLMTETRCGLAMALDVMLGRITETLVRQHAAHRRQLVHEQREQLQRETRRAVFPARREGWPRRQGGAGGGGRPLRDGMRRGGGGGFRAGTSGS